jgi:glycosyltransferase involved in cell wall biosynthesis
MKVALIAAYNEEDTIGSVVLRTKRHVDKVIVVDDGSKDKTAKIAQLAGATVVQHLNNGGKGEALKTGFEAAEKLNPDIVVCLDADCQHDPDDIPKVIAPILSGEAEMVLASRYLNKEHTKKVPRYRRFGLWVLTRSTNFGSKMKVTDTQCGFRAFSGKILGTFRFKNKGFSVESEMLEDAIENNIRIKEVSTVVRYDGLDTSTEKPGKHGLGVLGFIIRIVRDRRPLLFFGVAGAILLIIGLSLGIYCLNIYFSGNFIPFGPSIAAAVALLLGALSIFAGLILNSISGMINGLTKLNRSQEKKLLEDTDDNMILAQESLDLNRSPILYGNTYNRKIPGLSGLNYYHGDNLYSEGYNNMSGFPSTEDHLDDILPGNIIDMRIPKVLIINKNNEIKEPNGKEIPKPTVLNNEDEVAFEESNEDNNQKPLILNNNNRSEMTLKDIEDKNIHI